MEFYFWVFLCSSLLYLPFFFGFGAFPSFFSQTPLWVWSLNFISGLVQTIYFICLIVAYREGDLSLVYPISRSAPLFTLFWATLFIGEILSLMGVFGISLVTLGIFVISVKDFHSKRILAQPKHFPFWPYVLALIAALSGSIYSVVDKVAVQILHPVFYTWLINFWMSIDRGNLSLFPSGSTDFKGLAGIEEGDFYYYPPSEHRLRLLSHGFNDEQGELCGGLSPGERPLRCRDGNSLSQRKPMEDPDDRGFDSYVGFDSDRIGQMNSPQSLEFRIKISQSVFSSDLIIV